jgi:hypothetical protein
MGLLEAGLGKLEAQMQQHVRKENTRFAELQEHLYQAVRMQGLRELEHQAESVMHLQEQVVVRVAMQQAQQVLAAALQALAATPCGRRLEQLRMSFQLQQVRGVQAGSGSMPLDMLLQLLDGQRFPSLALLAAPMEVARPGRAGEVVRDGADVLRRELQQAGVLLVGDVPGRVQQAQQAVGQTTAATFAVGGRYVTLQALELVEWAV